MKIKALIVLVSAMALFIPAALLAEEQPQEAVTPLHHFDISCDACHTTVSSESNFSMTTANVGKLTGDISRMCTLSGCHDFDSRLSHPVGIKAEDVTPVDMPLDSSSRMTCLTCHEQRTASDGLSDVDNEQERSLYLPQGMEFCGTCHMNMGGTASERSHWQFSAQAHLDSSNQQFSRVVSGIDAESGACLSCHENITVTIPAPEETRWQKSIRWKNMSDHPIGMDYSHVAIRDTAEYWYPQMDSRIRLFDGKVGCGSCHSPYAQTDNNLVVSYEKSALCRQCHNK